MEYKEVDILFRKYQKTKDISYRNAIVKEYLPLTEYLIKRFYKRGIETEDLRQIAAESLISAVERFDISKGVKFQTFAVPTIIGDIKKHYRDKASTIRLPRRIYELKRKVKLATEELKQINKEIPNPEQISKHLNVSIEDVLEAIEAIDATKMQYIDSENEYNDYIPKKEISIEEDGFEIFENKELLTKLFNKLETKEKRILYFRFVKEETQKEVAEKFEVSQMTVSRWEKLAIDKLKRLYISEND